MRGGVELVLVLSIERGSNPVGNPRCRLPPLNLPTLNTTNFANPPATVYAVPRFGVPLIFYFICFKTLHLYKLLCNDFVTKSSLDGNAFPVIPSLSLQLVAVSVGQLYNSIASFSVPSSMNEWFLKRTARLLVTFLFPRPGYTPSKPFVPRAV